MTTHAQRERRELKLVPTLNEVHKKLLGRSIGELVAFGLTPRDAERALKAALEVMYPLAYELTPRKVKEKE